MSGAALVLASATGVLDGRLARYVHVRWRPDVVDEARADLESRFSLLQPQHLDGNTFGYDLGDETWWNIRALVRDPAVVDTINARLAAVGYPGSPLTTGEYPNPVNSTNFMGKLDHQVSGRDQLSVRYSVYRVDSSNSRGAGGTNAPSASAGLDNTDQSVAFSNTATFSARTVNETRAQLSYGDLQALPTDPIGPAVSIAGVTSFGTLS